MYLRTRTSVKRALGPLYEVHLLNLINSFKIFNTEVIIV